MNDDLVRSDIFLHNLSPRTLDALKGAKEEGLVPASVDITDDIAILRFERPKTRLVVARRDGFVKRGRR